MRPSFKVVSYAVLALSSLGPATSGAEPGHVFGTVLDETNAMTLPTAISRGGRHGAARPHDMDGHYKIELALGMYDFKISFPGYRERLATSVRRDTKTRRERWLALFGSMIERDAARRDTSEFECNRNCGSEY